MNNAEVRLRSLARPILAALAVAALVYTGFATLVGLENAKVALASVSGSTWMYVTLLSLFSFGVRYGRWHWWLTRQGSAIGWASGLAFYLAGFAFTTTPGKVGEIVRLWYFRKLYGIPLSQSAPLFVLEQVVDVLTVALLAALAVEVLFPEIGVLLWVVGVVLSLVVVSISLKRGARLQGALLSRLGKRWIRRIDGLGADVDVVMNSVRAQAPLPVMIVSIAWGLVGWCAPGVGLMLILRDLGFAIGPATAVGFFSLSLLAGVLSVFSAGLGTTEAALLLLLTAKGVDPAAAFAAAIVSRASTLWLAVGVGLPMLLAASWLVSPRRVGVPRASGTRE